MFEFLKNAMNTKTTTPTAVGFGSSLPESMVHFFNAFGFLKIPGFFAEEIKMISREFDKKMTEKFGDTHQPRNFLYPQFIDNDPTLADLLILPKVSNLATSLLGDGFTYKGRALSPG